MDQALHEFVSGQTGSGKSHYVKNLLRRQGAGLYFNTEAEDIGIDDAATANAGNAAGHVLVAAARGVVDYRPLETLEGQRAELGVLVEEALNHHWTGNGLLVIVDEAWRFAPQDIANWCRGRLEALAFTGRKRGIRLVLATLRPQDIAKEIVSQCPQHTIFHHAYGRPYFQGYGMPADEIERRIREGGDHAYVTWAGGNLSGPFKV